MTVHLPPSFLSALCAAAVLSCGLVVGAGRPVHALETCEVGLAVITPEGDTATIRGEAAGKCLVQLPEGGQASYGADMLMPDFGGGDLPDGPGLPPGLYACGPDGGAAVLSLELTEDGFYTDADGGEGTFAVGGDGVVSFLDGPMAGQSAQVTGGVLSIVPPGATAALACRAEAE